MGALEIPAYSIAEDCRRKIVDLTTAVNGKAAANHTHDDRYYTEAEVNKLLATKAAANHTHSYAATSHTHDDRYYTETEVNNLLATKAAATDVTALKYALSQAYTTAGGNNAHLLSSGGVYFFRLGRLVVCKLSMLFLPQTTSSLHFGPIRNEFRPPSEETLIAYAALGSMVTFVVKIGTDGYVRLTDGVPRQGQALYYFGQIAYYVN